MGRVLRKKQEWTLIFQPSRIPRNFTFKDYDSCSEHHGHRSQNLSWCPGLKSNLALVFSETISLVVLDFPQHKGYLRSKKPMSVKILLVTVPCFFKPSSLNADVIYFALVATTSCTFSEEKKNSTCKLNSHFESKAQPPKRLFLDFPFKNSLLPTRFLPFSSHFAVLNFQTDPKLFSPTSTHFHTRNQNFSHNQR